VQSSLGAAVRKPEWSSAVDAMKDEPTVPIGSTTGKVSLSVETIPDRLTDREIAAVPLAVNVTSTDDDVRVTSSTPSGRSHVRASPSWWRALERRTISPTAGSDGIISMAAKSVGGSAARTTIRRVSSSLPSSVSTRSVTSYGPGACQAIDCVAVPTKST